IIEEGYTLYQKGDTVSDRSVQPEQFGSFLSRIFDEWVRNDVGKLFVQTFEASARRWLGLPSGMCVLEETCGAGLALEHNGDLYSCDHFVEPDYLLGNIMEKEISELAASEKQYRFGQDKRNTLPKVCCECDVLFACQGECPKNRFLATSTGEPGLNYLCKGWKAFFHHIDFPMKLMAGLIRQGYPASEVMRVIALEEAFAQTGRNEPCPCGSGKKFKRCHGQGKSGQK
ncbi:MAG: SPASM domain-containing protein, partial [Methanosarcina flavescens]